MSTTTNNFGFLKPELSDAADITAYNDNWDKLDEQLHNARSQVVIAHSTDGISYTATVDGVDSLYSGLKVIVIPEITNTSISPTLNINNLGAKTIRRPLSFNTTASAAIAQGVMVANTPIEFMYDAGHLNGTWKINGKDKVAGNDLYGTVPVLYGGTGASNGADGLKNLLSEGPTILSPHQYGDELPPAGTPGRIFFKKVSD